MKRLLVVSWIVLGCIGCDTASDDGETSTDSAAAFIRCETNFDCPEAVPFCADNRCVACKADRDCPLGALCRAGKCVACTTDEHCGESCGACPEFTPYCNDAGIACGTCSKLHPCDDGELCVDGGCELCNTAEHCGDNCETCEGFTPYCNDAGDACGDCNEEHPCDAGEWCDNGACTPCENADHCGSGCEVCTGSGTPFCSVAENRCIECRDRNDCGGVPAVCSPRKTCTCEKVNPSDPKESCTDDSQCPHADDVCAQDYGSGQHYSCLRTCAAGTSYSNGISCQSRTTIAGGSELVWAPKTTCYANYKHLVGTACTPTNAGAVCSGLPSGFGDATCNNESKCSHLCSTENECSVAGDLCCGYCTKTWNQFCL